MCGICLGGVAAIMMVQSIQPAGFYAGSLLGAVAASVFSPLFLIKRNHRNIFPAMVVGFVLSFPVAVLSGMAWSPRLGLVLTMISILAVYYQVLIQKVNNEDGELFTRKDIFVVPVICLLMAGMLAYSHDPLPDDIPSLIKLMGDNDMQVSYEAARKLRKQGRAPFLEALHHSDSRIRSSAARSLGFLGDPKAQDALLEVSNDSNVHVRMWVAFSLGKIGDAKALETLNRLAKDDETIVRNEAIKAIENLRGK